MRQKLIMTIAMLLSGMFVLSACGAEKQVAVSAKITVEESNKKNNELSKELLKNVFYAKLDINSDGPYYIILETLEKNNNQMQTRTIGVSGMAEGKGNYRFAFEPLLITGENNTQNFIGNWVMDAPVGATQDRFQRLDFLQELPADITNGTNQYSSYYPILQEKNSSTVLQMNDSLILHYIAYQAPGPFDQTLTSVDDIKNSSAPYIYAVILRISDEVPSDAAIMTATASSEQAALTDTNEVTEQPTEVATSSPEPMEETPAKTLTPTVQRQPDPSTEAPTEEPTADPNPTITPDQGVLMTNQPLFPVN